MKPVAGLPRQEQALLDAHNRLRAQHCAAPLAWSPRLAASAQSWANELKSRGCVFGHSGGSFGENLAAGTTGSIDGKSVAQMWYDEVKLYAFDRGGFSQDTGHFTQLVWRGSTQLGCAMSQCNGNDIWVCQYDPPGNWQGRYKENVLPASCQASSTSATPPTPPTPTTPPVVGPSPTQPPATPAASGVTKDQQALLDAHNRVRAQHCAAPLVWSPRLASVAQSWANQLRDKGCSFGHSNGKFGENLAAGTTGSIDGRSVLQMWYDEVRDYNFERGAFSMKTGHFTQVVWRGSTQLGCAMSQCNGNDIWVCNYDPPGNYQGEFQKNVLPTGCR
ncbi:MAG: hypothetical protein KIT31_05710 [Deltaproteobacteria bacterium]|nr:hypothetical protein [Deltaproteobacteria bacterium]